MSRFPNFIEYGYGYWSDEKAFVSDSVIFCGGSDYINKFIISFDTGEIRPYDVGEEYYDGGNYTCGALRSWYDDSIVVSIPYRYDADGEYYSNRISLLNIKDPFDVKTVASYSVDIEGDINYSDCFLMPDDSLILFINASDLESKYCFLRLCSTAGVNENQGKGPESYGINTYPNPFNSSCEIELEYSESDNIKVDILDVNGKIIEELYNGKGFTGSLKWNPKDIESGVYFLNVKSSEKNTSTSTKLVYLG